MLSGTKIYGPVSKLIKVTAKYHTAIEIALGGAVQNIVVETENDAKRAIECLKSKNAGRATFLPLSSLKVRESDNDLAGEKGYLGQASSLVSCEKQFLPVVKFLLSKTAVIDTVDNAIAISKKHKNTLRLVTLEELLQPGGSMSGGSFYKQASLMGRENEIKALSVDIPKLEEEIKRDTKIMESLEKEISEVQDKVNKTLQAMTDNSGGILVLERDKAHNVLLINQIDIARRRVEEELKTLDDKIAETHLHQKEFEAEICEKEAFIQEKHEEIRQMESGVADAIAKKQELSEEITRQNILRSGVAKDLEVVSARISQLDEEISAGETNEALHVSEIEDIKMKNQALLSDIERKQTETIKETEEITRLDEENLKIQNEKKILMRKIVISYPKLRNSGKMYTR